jgi:hypothetical protein
MYEINAIILGVVQWGIVLIATLAQAGYLLARRQSRIPKGKVG